MASPVLVIAAGSAATTWDYLSDLKSVTYYPHEDFSIADISWNHNAQVLASCSTVSTDEIRHENVVLTASVSGAKLDALQHNKDWNRPGGATTSIAFGGKSRYLCLGDTSGAVCLWDLKKRLRVRQFSHDGYPSRQVALDPTDKLVLALADQKFSIYNLREGTLSSTLTPQGDYSYTRFSTSALEPHVAALGTRDGSILLYDITRTATDNSNNSRSGTMPFFSLNHRHSGSISGIAISPPNPQVVGTSSYDGTLKFFDSRSGETIHQVASLDSAITSLSLHAEGISCAVGTSAGSVLVYDLRKMLPVASIAVSDSVAAVQYALPPKPKASITTSHINPNPTPPAFVEHQRHQTQHQNLATPPRQHDDTKIMNHMVPQPRIINPQGQDKPTSPQKSLQTFATDNAQRGPTARLSEEEKSHFPQASQQRPPRQSEEKIAPALPRIEMGEIQDVVRDEVDNLRDDVEEAIRNLHMDMIRQFHLQSQEINNVLSTHLATIERLTEENRSLREEIEMLGGGRK